jgi:polysaccharide export outer membrane protein
VSLPEQGSATVTIVGEAIGGANTVKLKPAAERIAEIIGRTGGIKYPAYETHISLERKGKMATANFSSIVTNPSENIYVEPGDILYVWRYQPRFSVFGAVASTSQTQGLTGEFNFGNEGLMLHEALAKTGGLTDDRANANEIYVYRIEGRDALEAMGVDLCQFAPDTQKIPTIYRVNLRDPSGFFVMRMFPMRDKDIIYIANARAVEVTKFLRYIELMTNAATVISADMNATKINIRELGN